MTMRSLPAQRIGWLALAAGAVTALGTVSLTLFFTVGSVYGTLNDVCNAVEAVLSAALAWAMYPWLSAQAPRWSRSALGAAWAGALSATLGSALIIRGVTGWYLAGLYTMFGYALVGVWLWRLSRVALQSAAWPRGLVRLGLLAAGCMALGFLTGPGLLRGVDDPGAAAWYVNLGLMGSLGWMLLYPCWCVWLGRLLVARSALAQRLPQS